MISDAYLKSMIDKFKILEIVGCCDLVAEKAQKTAEKYQIKALTMDEIIQDKEIELVINLTIVQVHYSVVKQLLEAGKHVYTEKVLALTLEEGKELVRLADEKQLYLGVAPDTFLGASIQTVRYVVESGLIGDITSFYGSLSRDCSVFAELSPFTTKVGGGIAFDVGIYYLTALLSMLGPVSEVSGIMDTRNKERRYVNVSRIDEPYTIECENRMASTLVFENDTVGNLLFDSNSIVALPERPALVLYGTQGMVYMSDPNLFGGEVKVLLKGNSESFVMQQSHGFHDESRGLGAAELAWSLRKGRKHRTSKEMGYHALEVLHGIGISSQTKQVYELKSRFEKTPPLPRGYREMAPILNMEESSIAL